MDDFFYKGWKAVIMYISIIVKILEKMYKIKILNREINAVGSEKNQKTTS